MIDTVHSFHAPIYNSASPKRLSPSFFWGLGFAILLHLALLFYLFQENFNVSLPVDTTPTERPIDGGFIDLTPKPPTKVNPPVNRIIPHETLTEVPKTADTIPLDTTPKTGVEVGDKTPPVISNGSGGTAKTGTDAPVTGPVFVDAKWTRFPDGNAFANYYPERAAMNEAEGTATVECTVLDQVGHVNCAVQSETPRSMGFGQATVRMVQDKGRVDTSTGNVKIGSVLRLVVKWTLN